MPAPSPRSPMMIKVSPSGPSVASSCRQHGPHIGDAATAHELSYCGDATAVVAALCVSSPHAPFCLRAVVLSFVKVHEVCGKKGNTRYVGTYTNK